MVVHFNVENPFEKIFFSLQKRLGSVKNGRGKFVFSFLVHRTYFVHLQGLRVLG